MEALLTNPSRFLFDRQLGARKSIASEKIVHYQIANQEIPAKLIASLSSHVILNFDVDVQRSLIATGSMRSVILWEKKCVVRWKWTFPRNEELGSTVLNIFKIVKGHLVFSTQMKNRGGQFDLIHCVDLISGKDSQSIPGLNLLQKFVLVGDCFFAENFKDDTLAVIEFDGQIRFVVNKKKLRGLESPTKIKIGSPNQEKQHPIILASDPYCVKIEADGFFVLNVDTHESRFIDFLFENEEHPLESIRFQSAHLDGEFLFIGLEAYVNTQDKSRKNFIYIYDIRKKIPSIFEDTSSNLIPISKFFFTGDRLCYNRGSNLHIIDTINGKLKIFEEMKGVSLSSDKKILIIASKDSCLFFDVISMSVIKENVTTVLEFSKVLLQDGILFTNVLNVLYKFNYSKLKSIEHCKSQDKESPVKTVFQVLEEGFVLPVDSSVVTERLLINLESDDEEDDFYLD